MKKFRFLMFLLSAVLSGCSAAEKPASIAETPSANNKKLVAVANFNIGAAVSSRPIKSEVLFDKTLSAEFNQITAESEMKMNRIWTSETTHDFEVADYLVQYAQRNQMEIHGHTLVWYKSFPEWFKAANYDTVTFENKVKNYITTVVGRYKGKIRSWDVANEIFNDDGSLRIESQVQGKFKDPIGFIGRCFKYAREIDPQAKLFYNDYNVVLASGKRNAMKNMITRFRKEGYPIDGLGEQFHYRISTSQTSINNGFKDLASSGVLLHISEIDCKVNINNSASYVFTEVDKQKQSDFYKNIASLYNALPDNQKFAMTTWGVTDKYTWLKTTENGNKEHPLFFDADYKKKAAYTGFLEGLKY